MPSPAPPRVSIITPCYNEERSIGALLEAVLRQTLPLDDLEMVVADGGSTDRTREILEAFATDHPGLRLKLVDNPERTIPAGLNRALQESRGETVVRLDAHSVPAPDYLERCLDTLRTTGAANAGGVWEIRPGGSGWIAQGIARAVAHPLGAGDARYRISGVEGPVETVPFGAYPRAWLDRVGGYREELLTNEDYELNVRLRKLGGVVWLDPGIRSTYTARGNLGDLARQYWRYGFWKARMLRIHPRSLRWRQAVPAAFVLSTLVLAALAPFFMVPRLLLTLQWSAYLSALLVAGLALALRERNGLLGLGVPPALVVVHISWGSGFWAGLVSPSARQQAPPEGRIRR